MVEVIPGPRLAFYGDDFTGASDTLATLSEAGLRAVLLLGVPTAYRLEQCGPQDAIGIAGAARSMDQVSMRRSLAPVAAFLASLGAPVIQYKCCSTFDSSPGIGNLAVALAVFAQQLADPRIVMMGGQPSLGRYCAFGQLFATAGTPEIYRIDRHPTMSRHPVTPMAEADLRIHLSRQGLDDVDLVDIRRYERTGDIDLVAQRTLFDITSSSQLLPIGKTLWRSAHSRKPLLALGASSISEALIACWRDAGMLPRHVVPPQIAASCGPVLLLCGSQSPVTARQVAAGTGLFEHLALDPETDASADETVTRAAALLGAGQHVLIRTTTPRVGGLDPAVTARKTASVLQRVLRRAPNVRRVGIAGGDTSSFAVDALGCWGLQHGGRLADGVSLVRGRSDNPEIDGIELMLKGGQMGGEDIFRRLVHGVASTVRT